MSTPIDTPETDAIYNEHRHFTNEDQALEAVLGFRDLCGKLERERDQLRAEVAAERTDATNGRERVVLLEKQLAEKNLSLDGWIDTATSLRAELAELRKDKERLTQAFTAYIDLLVAELNDVVPIAALHGWVTKRAQAGTEARDAIIAAKEGRT